MAEVKVRLCPLLKEIARESELVVNMKEGDGLGDLIGTLTTRYKKGLKERYHIDSQVDFFQHFLISVNNEIVTASNLEEMKLKPGDTVEIFEPVAGG